MELELGLFDEAEQKFARAMKSADDEILPVAAYGYGVALLSMARRDNQDGKAGSAFNLLRQGVQGCQTLGDQTNICGLKLLGDLYSFGASLPPDVFVDVGESSSSSLLSDEALLRSQVEFISKGKYAYNHAQSLIDGSSEESDVLRASLVTDVGSNLVLQAQLLSDWESKGLHRQSSFESSSLFESAAIEFRHALELSPTYAPAWCGLGCTLVRSDPLLAQHAFARSLELEKLAPDPYANLSFLYTGHRRYNESARVSDALTEVADTPMMWINRALILEHAVASKPGGPHSRHDIMQAADAYRAALQVVKHPSAMVGLALTCRMTTDEYKSADDNAMVTESHSYVSEYLGMVGDYDLPTVLMDGVLRMEAGVINQTNESEQLIDEGRQRVLDGLGRLEGKYIEGDLNTLLNLDVFRQVVAVNDSDRRPVADDTDDSDVESGWSLHRRVVHQPNRGDLWMQLAKQLARNASTCAYLEPAVLAARRASSILMQQLTKTIAMPSKSEGK